MTHKHRQLSCGIVALAALSGTCLRAQTRQEVERALDQYFGPEKVSEKARARLREWDERLLPHLRAIAATDTGTRVAWPLVCALCELHSAKATAFWVEIIGGKTKVDPMVARGSIVTYLDRKDVRHLLADNAEFRSAIWKLRKSETFLDRSAFLTVVKALAWEDAAADVRRLTADMNPGVRREAVAVLRALTGEHVEFEKPTLAFRGRRPIENLFERGRALPKKAGWERESASFTRWFDGSPALLFGNAKTFRSADGTTQRTLTLDRNGHGFVSIGTGEKRMFVALVADDVHGGADYAIGWSRTGDVAWEYKPPTLGIGHAAVLHDSKGTYGVALAVGGETGIVALDAAGATLWQLPRQHVVYEIRTHRKLPGKLLAVLGSGALLQHGRAEEEPTLTRFANTPAFSFASHGALFPDAKGEPAAILAGTGRQGQYLVARFDKDGKLVWRAFLSGRAGGLAMVESKKHGRLFVVVTNDGALVTFDGNGMLCAETRLPGARSDRGMPIYGLAAGETAPGSWAVAVGLLRGWHLYRLRS